MTLSACIICFNEEKNIKRCLESLNWINEIIVVDSGSNDQTVNIAKQYTNTIFHRDWTGFVDQKNFALKKAQGQWILSLDADEEITDALRNEILTEIDNPHAKDGYRIPRLSYYQNRWIRHSGFYPDRQLRLFKRKKGQWIGPRVHERVEVNGNTGTLKNDLLHYPYDGIIAGQIDTVNHFSTLLAADLYDKGKRYSLPLLLFRPIFKFLEVYLLKMGVLDGRAGFIIAVTSAYAVFVRYVKLKEREDDLGK